MARVPVIKATNLTKKFELGKITVAALEGVNLEIYSGEFIIFFGPSGCGKSTLMSMIAGLQPPTSGKLLIRGEDISQLNEGELATHRRTKIGMVFQSFNLIPTMNVVENIALPLSFARISKSRRMVRAENLLETVGMSEYKKHTPAELSGGQQQRIALARSLVANPWIMLADEPTGNLDSKSADEVMRLLISLNRKSKRTVILITHNPDYLVYADRNFYLKDGKIVKVEVNSRAKGTSNKKEKSQNAEPIEDASIDMVDESKDELPSNDIPEKPESDQDQADITEEPPVDDKKNKKDKKETTIKPMRLN